MRQIQDHQLFMFRNGRTFQLVLLQESLWLVVPEISHIPHDVTTCATFRGSRVPSPNCDTPG